MLNPRAYIQVISSTSCPQSPSIYQYFLILLTFSTHKFLNAWQCEDIFSNTALHKVLHSHIMGILQPSTQQYNSSNKTISNIVNICLFSIFIDNI
jgi:hypothetical protein